MKGTKVSHTLPMALTPNITTKVSIRASMPPTIRGSKPYSDMATEMALLCVTHPMPNEAMNVKRAKATASHLHFMPRSMAYIGPPRILPSASFTRYLTARRPPDYLVAMPRIPVNQHQNTAPGPPMVTAVATPMMLPAPMVAASPVANALN